MSRVEHSLIYQDTFFTEAQYDKLENRRELIKHIDEKLLEIKMYVGATYKSSNAPIDKLVKLLKELEELSDEYK